MDKSGWVGIDAVHEVFAGIEKVSHGRMAVVACHLFSHSFPETLDRILVGTVGRQSHEREAEFACGSLYAFGPMPRGSVPFPHLYPLEYHN